MKIIGVVGGASGNEIVEQLHKKGIKTALVAGKNGEAGTDKSDYVLTVDLRNVGVITSFFKSLGIKYIILATGHRFAFSLIGELEKEGFISNINLVASLRAKDKACYKEYIMSKGFLSPAFVHVETSIASVEEIEATIGFPCVVKATIDTMLPQKVKNREELLHASSEIIKSGSPVLIEQYIKGIDMTVPVIASKGKAVACALCYYSKAEECELKGFTHNEFSREKLSDEAERAVMHYCEKVVLASEFEGLPRVDIMAHPDGTAYVLEVNSVGVTGLSDHHEQYCNAIVKPLRDKGIDLAEIVVDTALKKFMNICGDI